MLAQSEFEKPDPKEMEACFKAVVAAQKPPPCESPIDPGRWASGDTSPDNSPTDRQRIADQLIACNTLDGASRSEVRDRLGAPDNYLGARKRYETWVLGPERGIISIDDEHFVVRYDETGAVDLVEIAPG